MKIGEVAQQAGIAASTIRYYEQIGLLEAPPRISTHRVYEAGVVHRLRLIRALQKAGLSLDEMRSLLHPEYAGALGQWQRIAHDKLSKIKKAMRHLEMQRQMIRRGLECVCTDWQNCALLDDV